MSSPHNGSPQASAGKELKIAIVGGGCAGVAAAWQLQQLNKAIARGDHVPAGGEPHRYVIDLYEASWRLGGKAASGRDNYGRISEHGLHIWLGFYENAFRMMRECYEEVRGAKMGPKAEDGLVLAHGSIEEAFVPEQHIGVATKNRAERWEAWTGYLPPIEGLPGTPFEPGDNPFSLTAYLARALALTRALIISVIAEPRNEAWPGEARPDLRSRSDEAEDLNLDPDPLRSPAATLQQLTDSLRNTALVASAILLQCVTIVEVWLRDFSPGLSFSSRVLDFLEAMTAAVRRRLADVVAIDDHVRRKTEIIDLVITVAVGLYRDRVLFSHQGLDSINGSECRRWLKDHGATDASLASPFITGLYDLAFCYVDGDRERPSLAAGQALRGVLRMFFSYRGSLFWRVQSTVGDGVFAPLYRVLGRPVSVRKKDGTEVTVEGVRFHFLHKLEGIEFNRLSEKNANNRVERLVFSYQKATDGNEALDPNDALDAAGCWPDSDARKKAGATPDKLPLDRKEHFDAVIVAIGIEDFKKAGVTLLKALPRWERMGRSVKTVGTRAAQAWLDKSTAELGWRRQPVIISALDSPFETWADMTHTLASEAWWRRKVLGEKAPPSKARSVHYFCGVLPEQKGKSPDQAALDMETRHLLKARLSSGMAAFWAPTRGIDAIKPLEHLVGEDGTVKPGDAGLDEQHVQANALGSARFTLSLPGTLSDRISPLDESIVNMSIAGDWTACGFEESCVEAAVMSGMLAASALSGFPAIEDIIGYDHP